MSKTIGILTAGGDSPGLNAAIRGVGKAAIRRYGMRVVGFRDGFRGLMENRFVELDDASLSGLLTVGGTILGASRDKPHRMLVGSRELDMTDVILENCARHGLDALICLGGGGTLNNAYRLMQHGLKVVALPKTIDNDVAETDVSFGFDTAMCIATEALDRLHSTAHSHHRIIVVETMGHNAGWLALGSGLASGADVILIPEIPYDTEKVAEAIRRRSMGGRGFSIVAVSEGAMSVEEAEALEDATKGSKKGSKKANGEDGALEERKEPSTVRLTRKLEDLTNLESRLTILGHVQRGGTPSPFDRVLATRLGTACARYINDGVTGVLIAARGDEAVPVPLEKAAGKTKTVPLDHPWVTAARDLGLTLGD